MPVEIIQVRVPGAPSYDCRSRLQAYAYLAACWLRGRWPFDRRHVAGEGPDGAERRGQ